MFSKVTFLDKDFLQKLILDLLKCYTVHLSKKILVVLFMKQTAIINDETVRRLVVTKRLKEKEESINSLDFSPDGLVLATASDEDSINIYSINNASLKLQVNSKKYGCELIRFLRSSDYVLHGSTKIDSSVRYLSIVENKYIRYFSGHTDRVVCVATHPNEEFFLSGSRDKTIRLWDARVNGSQGSYATSIESYLDFDPDGLMFAAITDKNTFSFFDFRALDKVPLCLFNFSGPYNNFPIPEADYDQKISSLKFSPCGNMIMLTTFDGNIYLLDGLHGNLLHTLSDHVSDGSSFLEASFTKDSAYVFAGSCDGNVYVWKTDSGSKYIAMCGPNGEGIHSQPVRCLRFNPKYWLMVTASSDLKKAEIMAENLTEEEEDEQKLDHVEGSKNGFRVVNHFDFVTPVKFVSWAPGTDCMIIVNEKMLCTCWNLENQLMWRCAFDGDVYSLSWCPNGYYVSFALGNCFEIFEVSAGLMLYTDVIACHYTKWCTFPTALKDLTPAYSFECSEADEVLEEEYPAQEAKRTFFNYLSSFNSKEDCFFFVFDTDSVNMSIFYRCVVLIYVINLEDLGKNFTLLDLCLSKNGEHLCVTYLQDDCTMGALVRMNDFTRHKVTQCGGALTNVCQGSMQIESLIDTVTEFWKAGARGIKKVLLDWETESITLGTGCLLDELRALLYTDYMSPPLFEFFAKDAKVYELILAENRYQELLPKFIETMTMLADQITEIMAEYCSVLEQTLKQSIWRDALDKFKRLAVKAHFLKHWLDTYGKEINYVITSIRQIANRLVNMRLANTNSQVNYEKLHLAGTMFCKYLLPSVGDEKPVTPLPHLDNFERMLCNTGNGQMAFTDDTLLDDSLETLITNNEFYIKLDKKTSLKEDADVAAACVRRAVMNLEQWSEVYGKVLHVFPIVDVERLTCSESKISWDQRLEQFVIYSIDQDQDHWHTDASKNLPPRKLYRCFVNLNGTVVRNEYSPPEKIEVLIHFSMYSAREVYLLIKKKNLDQFFLRSLKERDFSAINAPSVEAEQEERHFGELELPLTECMRVYYSISNQVMGILCSAGKEVCVMTRYMLTPLPDLAKLRLKSEFADQIDNELESGCYDNLLEKPFLNSYSIKQNEGEYEQKWISFVHAFYNCKYTIEQYAYISIFPEIVINATSRRRILAPSTNRGTMNIFDKTGKRLFRLLSFGPGFGGKLADRPVSVLVVAFIKWGRCLSNAVSSIGPQWPKNIVATRTLTRRSTAPTWSLVGSTIIHHRP
ncbi:WD repeat-containing protein 82 [Trichinella patagoniensis]|uniref:WD repeat-containing protein 82 n=2 Tax=Trichinella patagoniensis TaxID=990121 RepID=A0A0V0ZTF9_9BILA|nr:WD repeat-containing protein 82 [Trichinella patagoniensis]